MLIPLLRRALRLGQKQAQLTSLLMMLPPVALPGVLVYASDSAFAWGIVAPVALGFLIGAFAGAELTRVVPAAKLARGFALLLVTAATVLIVRAVG